MTRRPVRQNLALIARGDNRGRSRAGADAVEFVLRAVGLDAEEARRIANSELPPLSGCGPRHSSQEE